MPEQCEANGHMFYMLLNDLDERSAFIASMREADIMTPFHYASLHTAEAGKKYGRFVGSMTHTNKLSDRLVRLPVYFNVNNDQDRIISCSLKILSQS